MKLYYNIFKGVVCKFLTLLKHKMPYVCRLKKHEMKVNMLVYLENNANISYSLLKLCVPCWNVCLWSVKLSLPYYISAPWVALAENPAYLILVLKAASTGAAKNVKCEHLMKVAAPGMRYTCRVIKICMRCFFLFAINTNITNLNFRLAAYSVKQWCPNSKFSSNSNHISTS